MPSQIPRGCTFGQESSIKIRNRSPQSPSDSSSHQRKDSSQIPNHSNHDKDKISAFGNGSGSLNISENLNFQEANNQSFGSSHEAICNIIQSL